MAKDKGDGQKKKKKAPAPVAMPKPRVNRTLLNKERLRAKDAKRKQTHKAHPHDKTRGQLRAQWRKEARKVSNKGWVPPFAVWLALKKEEKLDAALVRDSLGDRG